MKKPLSYLQYLKGNIKKVLSLVISIIFSILLIGSIHMFLTNSIDLAKDTNIQYQYLTVVETNGLPLGEEIYKNPNIKKIIPIVRDYILFQGMAINSSADIFYTDRDSIIYLMSLLEIDYHEDSIPENDLNHLILDDKLMINNKFQLGEVIKSNQVIIQDGFKSDYLLGFIPTSHVQLDELYTDEITERNHGFIIIPETGKFNEMNEYLKLNVDPTYKVLDKIFWDKGIKNTTGDVELLFNIVSTIIIFSIGIGLGISSYVHYFQRRKEFGVLSSLGYSDKKILLRINKEIFYTSITAFFISVLLLLLEQYLINSVLMIPRGIPGFELDGQLFTRILVIPLFTSVFSLIPTWVLLRKIDSVSIIEGEI